MALVCALTLNRTTYDAGSSPMPSLSLRVYNPNASDVAVTAVQFAQYDAAGRPINAAVAQQVPPVAPGQTVVVPALSSITFGPMPVAVGSGSSMNSFYAMTAPAGTASVNPQLAMPPQTQVLFGGTVYGSDGSANEIGRAGLTVSYMPPPPQAFQGGYLQLSAPNNFVTGLAFGVL